MSYSMKQESVFFWIDLGELSEMREKGKDGEEILSFPRQDLKGKEVVEGEGDSLVDSRGFLWVRSRNKLQRCFRG